ncbi:carbohydrate ABC transporter permease [Paenibacillus apiarius]|uniref:Carbohydrate ABC transporter permease n=1 Tax=Paenibacillus apiarius TaxID=46240 RepID=A0ABT4DU63_9BACL|nr:carbohydrate ABC transporter permease [Paenibacillus apiarius]MCY9515986.1 carbohydrate ABC transporter permease [Paenibacillus apiarius]MCY9520896.1 carbohydrate ABC transporter permease [Paenibacillus apiarius]MCY9553601.1 carbohydrate ABC transporter permease [Paenibacillus apiarius]MCY9557876.1 carbohydrate ABC transporter permease [Paenibacillus apiarius]MCY9685731.1 carbohydrate ABC transporter permease [Paenibacillus apiarius]
MAARLISTCSRHFFLILVLLFAIGPIALLFMNAVKPPEEFQVSPFSFPSHFTFDNIMAAWNMGEYGRAYLNSIAVGFSAVAIICVAGGLCAYALAKMDFKGKGAVLAFLFLCVSVPLGMFLVPLFYMWQKLHLMNTLTGLIMIYSAIFLPLNIFILRTFFLGIPKELSESARIDGCNEGMILMKIIVPIAKPAFLTVALLAGLYTWNEFFFANAFVQTEALKPVSTKYLTFVGNFSSDWSKISAAGLISILPFTVIYMFLQRRFIEGVAEGSLKG